jgi:hypothetical protein
MTLHYYFLPVLYFEKIEPNSNQAAIQMNHVQSAQMKEKKGGSIPAWHGG